MSDSISALSKPRAQPWFALRLLDLIGKDLNCDPVGLSRPDMDKAQLSHISISLKIVTAAVGLLEKFGFNYSQP
jgi:hypothetical protein